MKKVILTLIKIIVLVLLFAWMIIIIIDYFRVKNEKDPVFCLSTEIKEYEDGFNSICYGAAYKVIRYNRECLSAIEFGPFIIEERQCE